MKTLLNRKVWFVGLAAIAFVVFQGNIVTLTSGLFSSVVKKSATYAAGQTDTVKYSRERGLSALSFGLYTADSSNITRIILKRVINGVATATIAGDTLMTTADSSATARSLVKAVTLAPLSSEYWFIVVYKANTGVIDQGTTTPTVTYELNRQFSVSSN